MCLLLLCPLPGVRVGVGHLLPAPALTAPEHPLRLRETHQEVTEPGAMAPWHIALLLLSLAGPAHSESRAEEPGQSRGGRAAETPPGAKCTYTFIVPQQKFTGAVCWSSVRAAPEPPGPNGSETRALQEVLGRQQAELERLRGLVEVDGALVSEVKALRKESRAMNARVGQLYAQLLHEILQRRQWPGLLAQLEGRVANASAQALRLAAGYRQLELRYQALAALINNQSALIARLERRCQGGARPAPPQPPLVPVVPLRPSGVTNESRAHFDAAAELQMDQMEPAPPTLPPTAPGPWRDCLEARRGGHRASGVYVVQPAGAGQSLQVWCEQELEGGGWTVIQRRQDGSVSFFTTWQHYKHGFGTLGGEHWLGLENTRQVTGQGPGPYALRVLLEDWAGRQAYAHYDRFALEPESDSYRLRLGWYRGSAGDSLAWHDGCPFSTLDRDHDAYSGSCAQYQKGGWWYNACAHANLNGVWYKGGHYRSRYQDGVYWAEFRGGAYSLRKVVMMVRPAPPAPDAA
ncbi:angiopoietin-related protein 6 isoform X1 [Dermochelys coriacea]|uniref:angiopoietin-related protein 6 isoform X1 n=2 Tax=Dermochelys coriacea TaxID=27794 RepID=UPI0018E90597|nr:angiopoietin-related protein 6 isoform X1 [Dermochelys coriacea]